MSKRGRTYRESHVTLKMDYEGIGELLVSDEMDRFVYGVTLKARKAVNKDRSPETLSNLSEVQSGAHNRHRGYVKVSWDHVWQRNKAISDVLKPQ